MDDQNPFQFQPQQRRTFQSYVFDSAFDSGNMGYIAHVPGVEDLFVIWIAPDCAGTPYETGNRTWFYFGVSTTSSMNAGRSIKIIVKNMNSQGRLYKQGLRPFTRHLPHQPVWSRLSDEDSQFDYTYTGNDEDDKKFQISWRHHFSWADGMTYYAFCHPFGYDECQAMVNRLTSAFEFPGTEATARDDALRFPSPESATYAPHAGSSIYFHRQKLCKTLEGRDVELLTVTSSSKSPGPPDKMPVGDGPAAATFQSRSIVFASARVHPGETPGQFAFNGFMRFILSNDPRANALRELFVFKFVPMLNPDGVARGHYRCNSRGLNLNRFYDAPDQTQHEAVWVVKQALMHWARQGQLLFYLDSHGHATKRGCFLLGNYLHGVDHAWNTVFSRLCMINSPHFDLDGCEFDEKRMNHKDRNGQSHEGAGRVSIYKDCGLYLAYTLECNYNTGRFSNKVAPPAGIPPELDNPRAVVENENPVPYDQECWAQVGEGIAQSILDMFGHNCHSRLAGQKQESVLAMLKAIPAFRRAKPLQKSSSAVDKAAKVDNSGRIRPLVPPTSEELAAREKSCGSQSCCWVQRSDQESSAYRVRARLPPPLPGAGTSTSNKAAAMNPMYYTDSGANDPANQGSASSRQPSPAEDSDACGCDCMEPTPGEQFTRGREPVCDVCLPVATSGAHARMPVSMAVGRAVARMKGRRSGPGSSQSAPPSQSRIPASSSGTFARGSIGSGSSAGGSSGGRSSKASVSSGARTPLGGNGKVSPMLVGGKGEHGPSSEAWGSKVREDSHAGDGRNRRRQLARPAYARALAAVVANV